MRVVIIGSGGREHAICLELKNSKKISKIYCIPGNAGTAQISENIDLDFNNFDKLKEFVYNNKVDLVIVGPEKPLVDGITDFLVKNDILVFGPDKVASQLEGSKKFTKELCKKYNIPTANFGIFKNLKDASNFLEKSIHPIVVKADGLAAGKGVYICEKLDQSISAVKEIFNGKFGDAKTVLIEEFLKGEEMSFFIISDGVTYKKFGTAQDHKRVLEGDKGKNTGGMGAYSPSRLESEKLNRKILDKIIEPTLRGLKELNTSFCGFLYAGLMIVKGEPFLIEYNVRMGDPECQTILPRLKTDFGKIIEACLKKKLNDINIEWENKKSLCVVLCARGYPDKYDKGMELKNIHKTITKKDEYIFHAGTKKLRNKVISDGGRVLNFVVKSNEFKTCRDQAIRLIKEIDWNSGFFRNDIGHKVIE